MSWGFGAARLLVLAIGLTLAVVGVVLIGLGGPGRSITGVWLVAIGLACIIGTLIERVRYRSEVADRTREPHGPGGGEPIGATLEPRFRRSDEVFIDPTSSRTMRVWIDPGNGERRYVAED